MLGKMWDIVKLHWRGFAIGAGLTAFGLYVRGCTKAQMEAKASPLPPNVSEKVSIKNGVVTIQTPTKTEQISGVREGSISIMKDGTSKLDVRTFGWEHQIGMNGIINRDGGALGLDLRAFYYKKADVLLGVDYAPKTQRLDAWIGVGYTPRTSWISNTTLFVGYSVHNNPIIGVSVRF